MSIYVGLSRRTQCDRELGAVLVKEDISKLQLSPSGTSGYLVCMSLHTYRYRIFFLLFTVWGYSQESGQVWSEQWPG